MFIERKIIFKKKQQRNTVVYISVHYQQYNTFAYGTLAHDIRPIEFLAFKHQPKQSTRASSNRIVRLSVSSPVRDHTTRTPTHLYEV